MTVVVGEPRGPIARPRDCLLGSRTRQGWEFDLLDRRDRVVQTNITGVLSAQLQRSVHQEVRTSGSMTVRDPARFDWWAHRVGIRYVWRCEQGHDHDDPVGVFVASRPGTGYNAHGATASIDLYDKMAMLSQGGQPTTWTVDKGTTVAQAVRDILATVGETRVIAPDDEGGTLTSAMTWDPDATKLRMANDVLAAGNFFSLWTDVNGVWRLDPYVEPTRRGVEWTHRHGEDAIFAAEFEHEADDWNVPNVVKIVGKPERDEDGEELPAPYATAYNQDPDDPLSLVNRHEVQVTETDQDTTGLDALGALAQRRLLELSSVTSTYDLSYRWIPVDLNAAQRFQHPEHGIDALTVLQSDSWSWDAASDRGVSRVEASLREVKA